MLCINDTVSCTSWWRRCISWLFCQIICSSLIQIKNKIKCGLLVRSKYVSWKADDCTVSSCGFNSSSAPPICINIRWWWYLHQIPAGDIFLRPMFHNVTSVMKSRFPIFTLWTTSRSNNSYTNLINPTYLHVPCFLWLPHSTVNHSALTIEAQYISTYTIQNHRESTTVRDYYLRCHHIPWTHKTHYWLWASVQNTWLSAPIFSCLLLLLLEQMPFSSWMHWNVFLVNKWNSSLAGMTYE